MSDEEWFILFLAILIVPGLLALIYFAPHITIHTT